MAKTGRPATDPIERLLSRINKTSGVYGENNQYASECWLYTGYINKLGYGTVGVRQSFVLAHRLSYEHFKGEIPDGLCIDHLCRVRSCVNPDHLEPVTPTENVMRGDSKHAKNARKTHCKHGHSFDDTNTGIDGRGRRYCKLCARDRRRKHQGYKGHAKD